MGCSCDFDHENFTLSSEYAHAVRKVFCDWYHDDLIYKGRRIVNWCPSCTTAIADDEAEYVDPCMFGEALTGGYVNKTFIDIEKIPDANCPQGKAAFTIDGYYTMGATGVRVTEYDQTKAMENADLIIANCFANGRAVDDNVAVIFDVTKLEEYVINVHQTSTASV